MLMALVILAVLFIAGLTHTLYSFPTKMLMARFQSLFTTSQPNSSAMGDHQKLKSTTTAAAATNQIKAAELKSVFATFDKNDDGFITKQELEVSLRNLGIHLTEKDVVDMVEKVDSNGDGLIDLEEFCELFESEVVAGKGGREEEGGGETDLKEAFDVFDGDKDGLITVEELGLVLSSMGLKEGQRLENCKEMIRNVDIDGDGMVNFDEFKRMMKAGGRMLAVS